MKKIYFLIIAAIMMVGVSCEKENTNKDGTNICVLQQTTWSIPEDPAKIIVNFSYDVDGNLVEIEKKEYDLGNEPNVSVYAMTYSGNQLKKIKLSFDGTPFDETFFYYSGDKVDSIRNKTIPSERPWSESYSLVEYLNDKVSKVVSHSYNFQSGLLTANASTELEWTGNNVTRIISNNYNSGQPIIYDYLYDDKKSPLKSVGLGFTGYASFTALSENNVIKAGDNDVEIIYNSYGYPESIKTLGLPGSYPTIYEYTCN